MHPDGPPPPRALAPLVQRIAGHAADRPDAGALVALDAHGQPAASLTRGALQQRSRALAAQLHARLAPGSRVLLVHPPGLEFVVGFLATLMAGAVAVPVQPPRRADRADTPDRLAAIAADCDAAAVLGVAAGAAQAVAGLPFIATDDPGLAAADAPLPDIDPASLAVIQYTSGSTGQPRGVCIPHAALAAQVDLLARRFGMDDTLVGVNWLPHFHDMGLVGGLLLPLAVGGTVATLAPASVLQRPALWWEVVSRWRASATGGPDFAFELSVDRIDPATMRGLDLSTLRVVFNGAEPVRPQTMAAFSALAAPAGFRPAAWAPVYGLAEATLYVAGALHADGPALLPLDAAVLAAGQARLVPDDTPGARRLPRYPVPTDDLQVVVVDPATDAPLPDGRVGEILVRGASVGRGQWRDGAVDRTGFDVAVPGHGGGFVRTGDLGFLQDGALQVTGRLKDVIIVAGRNLHPADLERAADRAHPACRHGGACAFGVAVDGRDTVVLVQEIERTALRRFDAAEVAGAMRRRVAQEAGVGIDTVVFVGPLALPRTGSGKVQRSHCRARWQAGDLPALATHRGGDSPAVAAPRTATEAAVAALWHEVFGHAVGPDDDFFALGGSSLAATQIAVRLRERHGDAVPPLIVYDHPTVATQAAWLDAQGLAAPGTGPHATPAHAAPDDGPAPLSFAQERMWLVQQMAPHSAAYHLAAAVRLRGPLDADRLARDVDALVARHPALHSVIDLVDGTPRARRVPPPTGVLRRVACDDPATLDTRISAAVAEPYDLAHDLPLRPTLFTLAPHDQVLLVVCHHVAADLWTLALLLRELQADPDHPPPPGPDPTALARAQRAAYARQRDMLLAHWTRQLHQLPPLALPYDRPRPAAARHHGGTCRAPLAPALMAQVQRLAERQQATPYIVMLAALMALLHRLGGQDDIAVGAPVANRLLRDTERRVGTFVNTVVIRAPVDGGAPFDALLGAVRQAALDAYAHQDMPFEALVEALRPARDPAAVPLVQVLFNGLNAPLPPLTLQGLAAEPMPVDRHAAQFDLSFTVDFAFHRSLIVEYDTALFDDTTVQALLARYLQVLAAAVDLPGATVDDLPLLLPGERGLTHATDDAPPLEAADLPLAAFDRQVAQLPDHTALVCGEQRLSYAELDALAGAVARGLTARRANAAVEPSAPATPYCVALALPRTPRLVAALLGVLRAGAAWLPIDPDFPAPRVRQMLEIARPAVVLTETALAARLGLDAVTAWCLDGEPPRTDGPPLAMPPAPAADDLAYLIFTSGSTGVPKGVPIRQLSLANCLKAFARRLPAGPGDVMAALTTVSFDIAALELLLPLTTGGTLALLDRDTATSPRRLAGALDAHGVTLAQATPATWQMLLDDGWAGRQGLTALCGGETMSPALRDRLRPRVGTLWNVYGPTETTIWSTAARIGRDDDGPVGVGTPIDHTTVVVLDTRGRPVPPGVAGELHIGGLGLSPGYLGRDDLTRERFVDGPPGHGRLYRTGDLARRNASGALQVLGRTDFQVKLRGVRIELGDIESALTAQPGVSQAVVVADGDGTDRRLLAYVAGPAGAPGPHPAALHQALARQLPAALRPARITVLDALPLTPNGKIDRRALPPPDDAPDGPAVSTGTAHEPPTALQREIAALWATVLGGPPPAPSVDFFDAGGHSLRAVQLIERINHRFRLSLPMVTLFQAPTVAALAERVHAALDGRLQASDELPAIVRIQPQGRHPVFFCAAGFGGNTLHLHDLTVHLGPEQPFLGLQPHGLMRGGDAAPGTLEALAADYLRQIRAVQPHGPYHLGGFSGGGIDAFEVARQLQAQGETVALLVLMDSSVPALVRSAWPVAAWRTLRAALDAGWPWVRERVAVRLALLRWPLARWMARRKEDEASAARAAVAEAWLAHERVGHAWFALARRYRPGPYRGRVVLLQTRDSAVRYGPTSGWQAVVQPAIEVHAMPGTHGGFVREPHSAIAASALADALRSAREAAASPAPHDPL